MYSHIKGGRGLAPDEAISGNTYVNVYKRNMVVAKCV
jgi:hypothetical protein